MMQIRLTERGRVLARRLRQALEESRAVEAAWREAMTAREAAAWAERSQRANAELAAINAELEALIPDV